MRLPRLTKLIRDYIAPSFPGYRQKGRIFFKEPVASILRGYYFDQVVGAEMLIVWVSVQPLYVPCDGFCETPGCEVCRYEISEDNEAVLMEVVVRAMKREERHLDRLCSPASLVRDEWVMPYGKPASNVYLREISAYSQVMSGDFAGGIANSASLREFIRGQTTSVYHPEWLDEMDHRAIALQDALRLDTRRAVAMLNEWADYTKAKLKLP